MSLRSKGVTVVSAAAGLAMFSQSPELAQQYQQRLGGALDELRAVISDFDKDAEASEMSRQQALDSMLASETQFSVDRAKSVGRSIERFEKLDQQKSQMDAAHQLTRPLFVLRNPDMKLIEGVWADYKPAVPLTTSGGVYGGIGALLFALFARLGIGSWRKRRQAKRDRALDEAINVRVRHAAPEPPNMVVTLGEGEAGGEQPQRQDADVRADTKGN